MCFPKGRYQASVTKRRSQLQPTLTTSSTKKTQVKKLLIACKRVGDEGRDGGHARGGEREPISQRGPEPIRTTIRYPSVARIG